MLIRKNSPSLVFVLFCDQIFDVMVVIIIFSVPTGGNAQLEYEAFAGSI
jgi:hypothetical protein